MAGKLFLPRPLQECVRTVWREAPRYAVLFWGQGCGLLIKARYKNQAFMFGTDEKIADFCLLMVPFSSVDLTTHIGLIGLGSPLGLL